MILYNGNKMFRHWVLNCSAGELIGIGLAGSLAVALNVLVGEPQTLSQKLLVLLGMLGAGVVEGTSVSWFQWKVLSKLFPELSFRRWWKLTTAVALLGWTLGMLPSLFLQGGKPSAAVEPEWWWVLPAALAGGALAGGLFGLFQYFELRRHAPHAGWWIPANMLAWSVAMCLIFAGATWPDADTPALWIILSALVSGCGAGALLGVVTGWFLFKKIGITLPGWRIN